MIGLGSDKNLSPYCLKIFYVSTPADFLNWFLEQCPVNLSPQLSILAREGKRNKCLLWFGFATWSHEQSNAKGKSQHQHQMGNKESRSPLHTTPGPGSNKNWQKLPNIDCLKLPKTFPTNVVNITADLRKVFFEEIKIHYFSHEIWECYLGREASV